MESDFRTQYAIKYKIEQIYWLDYTTEIFLGFVFINSNVWDTD